MTASTSHSNGKLQCGAIEYSYINFNEVTKSDRKRPHLIDNAELFGVIEMQQPAENGQPSSKKLNNISTPSSCTTALQINGCNKKQG